MKRTHIMIHHSLTKDSKTVSWDAIRCYHKSYAYQGNIITPDEAKKLLDNGTSVKKPWSDIGYHFGVELVGDEYEIMIGRSLDNGGAHCYQANMNQRSIGICVVGNFDSEEVPEDQWWLTVKLCRALQTVYDIPTENVIAHRDYAHYKSCPGKNFDMDKFRDDLENGIPPA